MVLLGRLLVSLDDGPNARFGGTIGWEIGSSITFSFQSSKTVGFENGNEILSLGVGTIFHANNSSTLEILSEYVIMEDVSLREDENSEHALSLRRSIANSCRQAEKAILSLPLKAPSLNTFLPAGGAETCDE
jgi:hypothetical protein